MNAIPHISEAELEVMKVLWSSEQLTSAQIIEILSGRTDWKPKTIQTLITRLTAKGAISAQKTDSKAYLYRAAVSQEQYTENANRSFLNRVYNGSLHLMLTNFIKGQKLTNQEIKQLRSLLDEEEKRHE